MSSRGSNLPRRLSLTAVLAALALALLAPQAGARLAYTANLDSKSVSVFDTATGQLVGAPIPVADQPTDVAITPDGRTAYVPDRGGNLTAIDTATNRPTATIQLGNGGLGIAISPDGANAYVAIDDDHVRVVDLRANQLSGGVIAVGENVQAVAYAPDGRSVYVTDPAGAFVIDTEARQVVGAPIPLGPTPGNLVFTPDGRTALVLDQGNGSLYAIDTRTRQVSEIPVLPGEPLYGLAVTPDGTRAYVSAQLNDLVLAVDLQARRVVGAPIQTGNEPHGIAIAPDGRTAYVADDAGGSVTAIDTATNQARAIFPVAAEPLRLAVVPNQSPVASFAAKPSRSSLRVGFAATATDPDGAVAVFDWSFGDGTAAANAGAVPAHTYERAGDYTASLTVVDDEGCSGARVFTGSTAYCSGSALSTQAKTVSVVPNRFRFGKLARNPRKGTARLRVAVPAAGRLVLAGNGVRKAKGSIGKTGTVVLAIKPGTKLKGVLARDGRARTKVRVTFRPRIGKTFGKSRSIRLELR